MRQPRRDPSWTLELLAEFPWRLLRRGEDEVVFECVLAFFKTALRRAEPFFRVVTLRRTDSSLLPRLRLWPCSELRWERDSRASQAPPCAAFRRGRGCGRCGWSRGSEMQRRRRRLLFKTEGPSAVTRLNGRRNSLRLERETFLAKRRPPSWMRCFRRWRVREKRSELLEATPPGGASQSV